MPLSFPAIESALVAFVETACGLNNCKRRLRR
jgi:hypothetical protein